MKKKLQNEHCPRQWLKKIGRVIKVWFILWMLGFTTLYASSFSQVRKVSIDVSDVSLLEVLDVLQERSGYTFLFSSNDVEGIGSISLKLKNKDMREILDKCLKGTGLAYEFNENLVILRKQEDQRLPQTPENMLIQGVVKTDKGETLPGVSIILKGTAVGVTSGLDGSFKLEIPASKDIILVFSFVGMKTVEAKYRGEKMLNVVMEDEVAEMEEVVVTGIFQRKASSFTGSAVSMTQEDLMKVSNQNLFQSLKNMDPSLMIFDNLEYGSDPNKLPDMQLRGTSAFPGGSSELNLKGNYMNNPNQPLFILDGFEAGIEKIFDLDMNRIESVTILKDAAAKAIYGSKAANGVVVVETKKLSGGNLRVTYTGNVELSAPDLSSYHLCNAAEKLEVERLYGMYGEDEPGTGYLTGWLNLKEQYHRRLASVVSGVNTDWMAQPLRNAVGHKHTLSIEMGNENLRLITDFSYNNTAGVMKGSKRTKIQGAVSISYRHKNFNFRDVLTVDATNSGDSPYGTFSEYSEMNPYWSPYDEYGNLLKNAEIAVGEDGSTREEDMQLFPNPLYNAQLNTRLTQEYVDVTNNFYTEWRILPGLKATIRFGITKKHNQADEYYPANHLKFADYSEEDFFRRGTYQRNEGNNKKLSGDFNVNFSKEFRGKHYLFGNVGWNLSENTFEEVIFGAEGFPSDRMDDIMFALQYAKDSKPKGSEGTTRDMGFLAVGNYAYDNRYLFDASFRANASSQFGENNRWGKFWSVGVGWNIHNETFIKDLGLFDMLKLRGSMGYTGSQSFGAYQSMATYKYFDEKTYGGFLGAYLMGMENKDLKWQKKMDYNVGLDMNMSRKLNFTIDYYVSVTDNTLIDFSLPTSTGFPSVKENMGQIKNIGIEAKVNWTVYSRPKDRSFITVNASIAHNKNKITKISDALESYNNEQDKVAEDRFDNNRPVVKYYEGMSMNAIWAVRSLGIDPANGKEIYLTKNGIPTYTYSAQNQVVCGDGLPKAQGNFGVNMEYRGLGLNMVFRYQWGAQMYNQTLVDRIENVDMNYNVDKRVLSGRWQKPGDMKPFKSLSKVWFPETEEYKMERTQPTSRFIQDRNELSLSSINLYYDFYRLSFLKAMRMERLKLSFYMNDVFIVSSIRTERGLSYPFARAFNFSLQATF